MWPQWRTEEAAALQNLHEVTFQILRILPDPGQDLTEMFDFVAFGLFRFF